MNVVVNCIAKKNWPSSSIRLLFSLAIFVACLPASVGVTQQVVGLGDGAVSGEPTSQVEVAREALDDYQLSLEDLMKDPEFAKARQSAEDEFAAAKTELVETMFQLREIHLRYRNREQRDASQRSKFIERRRDAQLAINRTFDAAVTFLRFGGNAEAVQFLLTTLENYRVNDIYNPSTMEAATRLIDGGQNVVHLFETATRSAVVTGQFKLAKSLYEAVDLGEMSKTDNMLYGLLDRLEEDFEIETQQRELDAMVELPTVKFETTQGDFVIELFYRDAPSTISHLLGLVESGFYDGMEFTQVIDEILALTGDPIGNGLGNSGQFLIDESQGEDGRRRALRGSVVMAKLPTEQNNFIPNSASSQFAILYLPRPDVHRQQTIIGRVIQGMDVVSRVRRIDPSKEKKKGDIEVPADQILRAEVLSKPDETITPKYVNLRGLANHDHSKHDHANDGGENHGGANQ